MGADQRTQGGDGGTPLLRESGLWGHHEAVLWLGQHVTGSE